MSEWDEFEEEYNRPEEWSEARLDEKLKEQFDELIYVVGEMIEESKKPKSNPMNFRVHRIIQNNSSLKNEFIEKLNGLKEFIKDEVLISHYKYFEYEFLRRVMKFAGMSMIKNEWIDLQENFILQNNFGGDVYDVAKKLNLSFNENNNFFSVANAVSDLHHRMLN